VSNRKTRSRSGWADRHIEDLRDGKTITFRPRGRSMEPRIYDNQEVTMEPCTAPVVDDAVLCKVGGRVTLHRVIRAEGHRWQIANMRGHVDGWTSTIYGKVIALGDR